MNIYNVIEFTLQAEETVVAFKPEGEATHTSVSLLAEKLFPDSGLDWLLR